MDRQFGPCAERSFDAGEHLIELLTSAFVGASARITPLAREFDRLPRGNLEGGELQLAIAPAVELGLGLPLVCEDFQPASATFARSLRGHDRGARRERVDDV